MSHKYDNTVIFSLSNEHCERIVKWWNKELGSCYGVIAKGKYIGLIDGWFNVYTLDQVQKASATIIELPESKPQDLIGRKVRGFNFEDGNGVILDEEMKSFISQLGHITEQFKEYVVIKIHKKFMANPTSLIHEHLVDEEKVKPHSFCKETGENCTMSYCDENGCLERKRNLVDDDINVDTSEQNEQPSPKIIDLSNVEGVEMMVSDDGEDWFPANVVATISYRNIDSYGDCWVYAKPIEVKKVTMKEIEEKFGCKVEIVKEVSNEQ